MSEELIDKPRAGLEIASTGDGRDITRNYTKGLLSPYDRVLSGRGGSDLKIYEEVHSDPEVKSVFLQRRNAVIQAAWQVDAASESKLDQDAAEFLRLQLTKIGWDKVTDLMLYGVFYGYSVAEIIWELDSGRLGWKAVKVRNRRRFRFNTESELRLLTKTSFADGVPAKAPYFWHFATGSDNHDEPYGMGLGHWLYWPVLFKRNGLKFWLTFLEKFGMPTAVGKYNPTANDQERKKLLQATQAIQADSGIIIPEGMTLELLEAARSGSADYKTLHDTMNDAIAKAVLGQTMTSQDGSSEAQANVHMDVRQDIVKSDSDLVCESFNLGPVKWLIEFNFPGAGLPRVYRMLEQEEDLDKRAETDTKVQCLGFKPGLHYVKETYGEHWEEKAPDADTSAPAMPPTPVSFAAPDSLAASMAAAQSRLDAILAAATERSADWRGYVEPRVNELQVLLDESEDLEDFRARLVELADAKPNPEFIEAVSRAGFGAWLLGRAKPTSTDS